MNPLKTMALLAAMTALFLGVGWLMGGPTGAVIALGVAIATNAFAYWNSDKLVLRMHNARPVSRQTAPDLWEMVADLARRADMPVPAVYIIDDPQPNAFATGRDPSNAAVAATTGILRSLSREELAGVMAHELAHIRNRDTLTMTIAATVAGAISMLAQFGLFFGGGRDRPMGVIGTILAMILAPLAAMMIQSMISRTREYAADRLGAEICGNPMWLASALAKIAGGASRHEMASAERNPASAHMFIVNPLSGRALDGLFSTHPPAEKRIAALRAMAGQGGEPGSTGWPTTAHRNPAPRTRQSRIPRSGGKPRSPWQ